MINLREFMRDEKGSAVIELIAAMIFMVIFGVLALNIIQLGNEAGQRVIEGTNSQADARIAANYVNSQIRMNDTIGRVEISHLEQSGRDAILIRNRTAAADFDRWIYFEDGKLLEALTEPYVQPVPELATVIAQIYNFRVSYDAQRNVIKAFIEYAHNDEIHLITMSIALRSDRTEGIIVL
ncbi:MAG: DUF4860 domain-containing protein [Defluviitaleaceae bacterium]|nr:DUF4860 domain-containing protein [Defluviitaleaceae bacterium]